MEKGETGVNNVTMSAFGVAIVLKCMGRVVRWVMPLNKRKDLRARYSPPILMNMVSIFLEK